MEARTIAPVRGQRRADPRDELRVLGEPRPTPLTAAHWMSGAIAILMIVASAAGLFVQDLYRDGAWAREALRGGDLVTLVVAAPLLIVSLALATRGSQRAQPVWIGLLAYSVYNYAYYAFGAAFNDALLIHIALLSLSVFALACALPNLDVEAIAVRFRGVRGARWVGLFLALVGALQGALWIFVLVRNAFTGELIRDVPVEGQHLVFVLDLSLLAPALVLSGILLFGGRPTGYLLGTAMAVMGAVYQVNMMVAGVFQTRADVAGAQAFAPESLFLTAGFLAMSLFLLLPRSRATRR